MYWGSDPHDIVREIAMGILKLPWHPLIPWICCRSSPPDTTRHPLLIRAVSGLWTYLSMIFGTSKEQIETQTVLICSWGGGKNLDFYSNTDFFQVKAMQLHFSCRPGIFELTGRLQWGCVCCAFCCRPWGDRWCWKFGNGDSLNVGVIVGEFPQFSVEMLFHLAFSGERGACPAPANSRIRPILWCPRLG